MILQTGLRTDIPAFYTPWFLRRVEEGFVLARNPYNPQQITRYRLAPDVVDGIGFCTKNAAPMLPHMGKIAGFGQHWFVTITPYGADIEPHVPPKEQVMADFRRLSAILGARCVAWRYDPILLTDVYTWNAIWLTSRPCAPRWRARRIPASSPSLTCTRR